MLPYMWIAAMLGLVIATVVVGLREKKARKKAMAGMQPQPLDPDMDAGMDPMGGDEFGDDLGSPDEGLAEGEDEEFK